MSCVRGTRNKNKLTGQALLPLKPELGFLLDLRVGLAALPKTKNEEKTAYFPGEKINK